MLDPSKKEPIFGVLGFNWEPNIWEKLASLYTGFVQSSMLFSARRLTLKFLGDKTSPEFVFSTFK